MTVAIILAAGCSRRLSHLTTEKPKSLIVVGSRTILENHLDNLYRIRVTRIIIVVGYLAPAIESFVGSSYRGIPVEYIINERYFETGHSYSLYLGCSAISQFDNVLIVHADGLYPNFFYESVLVDSGDDVLLYDSGFEVKSGDEVVVCLPEPKSCQILPLENNKDNNILGEYVGLHLLSRETTNALVRYLDACPPSTWQNLNYEPILSDLYKTSSKTCLLKDIACLPWVNINYEEDISYGESVVWPFMRETLSNPVSLYTTCANNWSKSLPPDPRKIFINIKSLCNTSEAHNISLGIGSACAGDCSGSLSSFENICNQIVHAVTRGPGFCVLKGIPDSLSNDTIESIYRRIGTGLGQLLPQDREGSTVYSIFDSGKSMVEGARYSRSSDSGSFHTDNPSECEVPTIVGLLCLRQAEQGGGSCLVNAIAVLDHISSEYPHLSRHLESCYPFQRRNRSNDSFELALFPLVVFGKSFRLRFLRDYISTDPAHYLTCQDSENMITLIDVLDECLAFDEFIFDYTLSRGDMLFFNNLTLAHGRRSFSDSTEIGSARLMQRIWLR